MARNLFFDRSDEAALGAVAARVERALGALPCARYAAILLRVDVRRHRPAEVAADLGLSTRQFHRERRVAHDRFLAAYRAPCAPKIESVSNEGELAQRLLARAKSLADSGEPSSAGAILRDLAGSGDPATRCEALIKVAEIETWAHRFETARAQLRAADAFASNAGISPERRAELRDAGEAAALSLRWFADGPTTIAPDTGGERAMLVRAAAALRSGELLTAARLLPRIEGVVAGRCAETAVDALTLQGEMADFTAEDPQASEVLFERAAALARAHGLGGRELYATHQLALTRWAHSRSARDRHAYRSLVNKVDRSLSPRLRSYLVFSAADIELAIGHPGRALHLSESAASVSTNPYESLSARGFGAGALLRLGRIDEAAVQAGTTSEAARSSGQARIVSLAQRINAQALLAKGDRRAARAAIEESIDCARHFSSAHVLATARAVLARIRA